MWIHKQVVSEYELDPISGWVYTQLCLLADDSEEQIVLIEQKALAKIAQTSRRSVQRALAKLVDQDLIEVSESERQHTANRYRLLQPSRATQAHPLRHTGAAEPIQPRHTGAQVLETSTTTERTEQRTRPGDADRVADREAADLLESFEEGDPAEKWNAVKAAIDGHFAHIGRNPHWTAKATALLKREIHRAGSVTLSEWVRCVHNRFASDLDAHVFDLPEYFIPHLLDYFRGPVDRFHRTPGVSARTERNRAAVAAVHAEIDEAYGLNDDDEPKLLN